jgi:signal peptidase complex subunit 2
MPRTRKQAANGSADRTLSPASNDDSAPPSRSPSSDSLHPPPPGPLSIIITDEEREVVKVNNASLTELKNACDDALKRVSQSSLTLLFVSWLIFIVRFPVFVKT